MERYIVMDITKWNGLRKDLTNGKKYKLINDSVFIDDIGNRKPITLWKGDVHIEVHDTYLYEVSCQGAFREKSLYVYADSKREAVAKALEVIGVDFDSIECRMVVEANKVIYAD